MSLDTLTLIPYERNLFTETAVIDGGSDVATVFNTLPTDEVNAKAYYTTDDLPFRQVDVAANNFTVPREGGVLVVAACAGDSAAIPGQQDKDTTITATVEYVPRWKSFRRGSKASW